jgi:glycosyltransferase involved in cell wall biosynthesis
MKLSVIIPCFNEVSSIETIIMSVNDAIDTIKDLVEESEIIVVDDSSTDGTKKILQDKYSDLKIVSKIIYHEKNLGKGAALRSGFEKSTGDILLIQDADLEYNPLEYSNLLQPIIKAHADVVYGSRFLGGQPHRVLYFWHRIGNGVLTIFSNMMTNLNLTDMETCYKVFKKDIIKNLTIEENRFGFEPEITAKISKMNCRIFEVGISYYGRTYSEGKKIGWMDGVRALYCILKYNLKS